MPGPTCSRRAGSEPCRLCVTAPSKCESRCAASSTPPDAKDVVTTHRHGLCARSVASPRLSDTTVPDTAPSLSCTFHGAAGSEAPRGLPSVPTSKVVCDAAVDPVQRHATTVLTWKKDVQNM